MWEHQKHHTASCDSGGLHVRAAPVKCSPVTVGALVGWNHAWTKGFVRQGRIEARTAR